MGCDECSCDHRIYVGCFIFAALHRALDHRQSSGHAVVFSNWKASSPIVSCSDRGEVPTSQCPGELY